MVLREIEMNSSRIYLSLFLLSAAVLCFEIVSTRISSVIFAYDFAFMILSFAILGLGAGGIFSYYFLMRGDGTNVGKIVLRVLFLAGVSFLLFIVMVTKLGITDPFIFSFLLIIPFFLAGIAYAQIFKRFAGLSFRLYAADLAGAAAGSIASIALLSYLGAPNSVLLISLLVFAASVRLSRERVRKGMPAALYSILSIALMFLVNNGRSEILGEIPIGNVPEKDFFHVYPNVETKATIIDSRWSIYGRTDLVSYSHQDVVRQLFIDGAAGTQMYRFNGNVAKPGKVLYDMLLSQTTAIPFLFLDDGQKNNMLVIGPGGGKEILMGLFGGVKNITGVEVNPDFVKIVRNHRQFDGGIYNDFPNVKIITGEGRSFVKRTRMQYDLIVMSLPSTQQLQNIDHLAMSENYLLTVEAIKDYMNILTPSGELTFTVHNRLELLRLIITTMTAFHDMGIGSERASDHFVVLEKDYAPTIVVRKASFSPDDLARIRGVMKIIPGMFPNVTYLPGAAGGLPNTMVNRLLKEIATNRVSMDNYINRSEFNIEPCRDDIPYFYELRKGISPDFAWLLGGVAGVNLAVFLIPFALIRKKRKSETAALVLPLIVFASIGLGFMIIEVTLFQKMVLYIGSPTIALSILLSSLLVGMGLGSYFGNEIFPGNIYRRLSIGSAAIIIVGVFLAAGYSSILSGFTEAGNVVRALLSVLLILPLGFLLGIPFPTAIQLLKQTNMEQYVPWMYGVNGAMSVLGSVAAVILSMQIGFTFFFAVGLFCYVVVFLSAATYAGG